MIFCGPTFAYPPIGGPELRVFNTLRAIAANYHVILVIWNNVEDANSNQFVQALETLGVEIRVISNGRVAPSATHLKGIKRKLRTGVLLFRKTVRRSEKKRNLSIATGIASIASDESIDKVWFSYANISLPILLFLRKISPNLFLVADTDSVWSRYILRGIPYQPLPVKVQSLARGLLKRRQEKQILKIADVTTAVSEVDQDYYLGIAHNKHKVFLAYNVVDSTNYSEVRDKKTTGQKNSILLAGTYGHSHSPMDQAASWFLREVWPQLLSANKEIKLYIVGRNSDRLWKSRPDLNIQVEGEVPSINPYLQECAASIVPLWFESGTRFKILEAAASRTPVVSTSLGAEGLFLKNGRDILIADSPKEFADSILRILNPLIGTSIANSAFKVVEERYSLDVLTAQTKRILEGA